jgi:two-component system, LytTR family, response regulator
MLHAILIDDERNALEVLEMQLQRFCKDVTIMAKCDGGEKGIEAIRKYQPDLVFLDIEMPHINGFDVLRETAGYDYNVIFTTAYDQFAIKAFKFAALDYLLKPIDIVELQAAVEKARVRKAGQPLEEKLRQLMGQWQTENRNQAQKIALPMGDALQLVSPQDIIRCESDSNYTHIFLQNGKKITVAKTLKEIEETLNGLGFFRVHQSHLVNMSHIAKLVKGDGGYVTMSDGNQIAISRNRKEAFLEQFRKI